MKYRLLSVGVMIGATAIVGALKKKEDSEKGKKKFKVRVKHRITGMESYIDTDALDRKEALSNVEEVFKKDYIMRGVSRG